MRYFLCGNAASAVVLPVISSPTPPPRTNVTMKNVVRVEEVSPSRMVVKVPHDEATPSVVTASTGIDGSHASMYRAIFQQTNQGDNGPMRYGQNVQSSDHNRTDKYIKYTVKPSEDVKRLVYPSNNVKVDDDHNGNVDISLMNRKGGSSTEDGSSTNALILVDNKSESISSSEPDSISRQSCMMDGVHTDDSNDDSTVIENQSSLPMNRISALTEAIAIKQSDIAIQFCSMIHRMKCIVENISEMQNSDNSKESKAKSPQYLKECQALHETAAKMATKQVQLAHQSTKYVERLEHDLLDLQYNRKCLPLSEHVVQQHEVPKIVSKLTSSLMRNETTQQDIPLVHEQTDEISETRACDVDDDNDSTAEEPMFCIQEISFRNSIVVDFTKLGAVDDQKKADSGKFGDSDDASNLRFLL